MKKILLLSLAAVIVIFAGCLFSSFSFKASIIGDVAYSLDTEGELEFYEEQDGTQTIMWITGHDDDTNTEIFFDVNGISSTGIIRLGQWPYGVFTDSNTATPTNYQTWGDTTTSTNHITIQEITDEFVKGIFNFVGKVYDSTRTVTVDGSFKIPIEEEEENEGQ